MTRTTGEAMVVSHRTKDPVDEVRRLLAGPGRHQDVAEPGAARGHRPILRPLPEAAGATVVPDALDGSRMPDDDHAEAGSGRAPWGTPREKPLGRPARPWGDR